MFLCFSPSRLPPRWPWRRPRDATAVCSSFPLTKALEWIAFKRRPRKGKRGNHNDRRRVFAYSYVYQYVYIYVYNAKAMHIIIHHPSCIHRSFIIIPSDPACQSEIYIVYIIIPLANATPIRKYPNLHLKKNKHHWSSWTEFILQEWHIQVRLRESWSLSDADWSWICLSSPKMPQEWTILLVIKRWKMARRWFTYYNYNC